MIKFFDLHCDTITSIMDKNENLYQNTGHFSIEKIKKYPNSIQVFAIWLNKERLKDPFNETNRAIDFFYDEIKKYDSLRFAKNYSDIEKNQEMNKYSAILSLEGLDQIEDIENIGYFYDKGVKIMTLTWNNPNSLGYGALSGIDKGLTDFGKECIRYMNIRNIIIDVSHLNEKGFYDVNEISDKPFIASHSNSYTICPSKRNLKDEQIKLIIERNGLIGLNLYPDFISKNKNTNTYFLLKHIDHFLTMGCENVLSLGTDFDGIDTTPEDIKDVSQLDRLYNLILDKFGIIIANKIFYENVLNFYKNFDICLQNNIK